MHLQQGILALFPASFFDHLVKCRAIRADLVGTEDLYARDVAVVRISLADVGFNHGLSLMVSSQAVFPAES